jgi:hypothetical protein
MSILYTSTAQLEIYLMIQSFLFTIPTIMDVVAAVRFAAQLVQENSLVTTTFRRALSDLKPNGLMVDKLQQEYGWFRTWHVSFYFLTLSL